MLTLAASVGTLFAESGSCGDNLTWNLTDSVLTISGTGAMWDYYNYAHAPWDPYVSTIKSVFIFDGVTSIGNYAFSDCSSVHSVTIPKSITNIGNNAFYHCSSLTSVTLNSNAIVSKRYISSSITKIKDIFGSQVSEYIIGEDVTSIGYNAFYSCSNLNSVTISNSVTSIEYGAFSGCSKLKSVHISDIAAWCTISFGENYANPLFYAHNLYLNGTLVTDLVIPNGVSKIGNYAFLYCYSLSSVTIPNSVISIGDYAFSHCTEMTSLNISNSVTRIGNRAFESCLDLTTIDIPNSVTSIGEYAFSTCLNLTSIAIPNSVASIEVDAFYSCSSLTSVLISDIAAWCSISFVNQYANPLFYAHNLYLNGTLVTDLVVPNSVNNIGNFAFYYCNSLTSVTIGNSVTSIGYNAFYGCSMLAKITIGSSVTSIGTSAFNMCYNLKSIYPLPITPPAIESSTFKNINNEARVYLTYGTGQLGAYAQAMYWKELKLYPFMTQYQYIGATSYKVTFDVEDIILQSVGIEGGEQQAGNVLEYIGLEPNSEYNDVPVVLTSNTGETETINVSFTTTALELTTKASKPVSSTTAILLAETNMSDAEVNCGFEYKRNDAPDDMAGTKVFCPVASGQMAGRLKNLRDDTYYKYRAFYQSAAENMYYGDWQYIFTGDVAVEFDPILYTYGATVVKETEATISGYALAGSEDFTEQGFEYWAESRVDVQGDNVQGTMVAPHRMPAALNEHFFVQASGIALHATLTDLDAGTVYKYRVYGKVGDQYYYGSEQAFTTTGTYTPPTYTITFVNWDGTELQSSQVEEGTLPEYIGTTPVRAEDEQYTYTFSGWSPAVVAATADVTYTAQYVSNDKHEGIEEVPSNQVPSINIQKVLRDGQIYIIRGGNTFTLQGQKVR